MNYSFGKIEKVIFLGGGKILLKMLTNIENRFEKVVFTSKNFIEENINGLNFEQHLKNLNIKYYVVDNLNDNEEIAREIIPSYTLGFSISARWIIKQNIIDLFGGKLVNLHGARLPQNRGGGWNVLEYHAGK